MLLKRKPKTKKTIQKMKIQKEVIKRKEKRKRPENDESISRTLDNLLINICDCGTSWLHYRWCRHFVHHLNYWQIIVVPPALSFARLFYMFQNQHVCIMFPTGCPKSARPARIMNARHNRFDVAFYVQIAAFMNSWNYTVGFFIIYVQGRSTLVVND